MPLRRQDRHDAQGRGRGATRRQGLGVVPGVCETRGPIVKVPRRQVPRRARSRVARSRVGPGPASPGPAPGRGADHSSPVIDASSSWAARRPPIRPARTFPARHADRGSDVGDEWSAWRPPRPAGRRAAAWAPPRPGGRRGPGAAAAGAAAEWAPPRHGRSGPTGRPPERRGLPALPARVAEQAATRPRARRLSGSSSIAASRTGQLPVSHRPPGTTARDVRATSGTSWSSRARRVRRTLRAGPSAPRPGPGGRLPSRR